jgi:hypothetical protein
MRPLPPALRRRGARLAVYGGVAFMLGAALFLLASWRLEAAVAAQLGQASGHRVLVGSASLAGAGVVARDVTVFGAPPFEREPLAHIDRLEVRLRGPRGALSPSAVLLDGLDLSYLRAAAVDNVWGLRAKRGDGGGAAGVRIVVRSGRLRGTVQPHHGPRLLVRARAFTAEVAPDGRRAASFEGLVGEVAGWLTASLPQLEVKSERAGATRVRAESASLIVPGGGPLVEELALTGVFAADHTEVEVTREPGVGRPKAVPLVRAGLRMDGHGGHLAVDAAELALRPLHAWLDRMGVQVDATRADLHLMASSDGGRPDIPFEIDLRARDVGISNPSIDLRGWRGLPVELHLAGALAAAGGAAAREAPAKVRIERGEVDALGARLLVSGWSELGPVPRGSWTVRTPPGAPLPCGRLLPGQPPPVRQALAGMKLAGNLGLSASVTFDAAGWDALGLDLGLDPVCEVLAEPRVLGDLLDTLVRGDPPAGAAAALPLGRYHPDFAPIDKMPAHLTAAFLTAEDGRFFSHPGFDLEMIRRALAHDLEMRAFAKGGSTITQQLAKNLFLPQSRTLARKMEETVLAWRLQTLIPKKRMLELYLNVIELGPQIRGVKQAARAYFGKDLAELRPIESAHLAALTPNPQGLARRFRDGRVDEGWMQRLYDLLGMMNRSGRLSRSDVAAARAGKLTLRKI